MNKKIEIITQNPQGIIQCDKDSDIYNVSSFSTDHRIVDMLLFECTCPSKDKSFCSHIRAVSKKFQIRYSRELFNIYSILNDINIKNSFATCYDKAENHFNLLLKSINNFFHFNNFLENQDFFTLEAKQRYKRVLCAILRSLSSISWRYHLIKTKDSTFINSICYANNARNSIKIDFLLDSINFSLSSISREDFSSSIDFLQSIESKSLEKMGILETSIVNIITKIFSEQIVSNENKERLIHEIIELFFSNRTFSQFYKGNIGKKSNLFDLKFLKSIFKTINRYMNLMDSRFIKESINFILIEEFGLNLDLLSLNNEDLIREASLVKNITTQSCGVVDLYSLRIRQIDSLLLRTAKSLNNNFFPQDLLNIIHSAPILVDLYDHLFWYSTNYINYGELTDFLDKNINNEIFNHFFFIRFSSNGNKPKSINSRMSNNKFCIYKLLKPNNEKYSATHIYYSWMINSINKCDSIKTLNYFIGGCIQEKGIDCFIKLFPKEMLITDISLNISKSFNIIDFFSRILIICPPIIYLDLWDYLLMAVLSALKVDKDAFTISLIEFFARNNNLFELNKLIHVLPHDLRSDFFAKFYYNSSCSSELSKKDSEPLKEISEVKLTKSSSDDGFSFEGLTCKHCLDHKPLDLITCKSVIASIQKQKFGISDGIQDAHYNRIIESYTRIINQSCKNLSSKLYSKINHFIFELMQNADDNRYCSCVGKIPSLIFVFYKSGILMINNETGFTEKDVSSICDIGNSSKTLDEKKIGYFGIGFKSVFSITNTPYIFSNGFCFKFNLNSYHGSYIFPEWVDERFYDLIPPHKLCIEFNQEISSYKTKIWLPFKDGIHLEEIKLNENIILFTNKIKRIKLINDSSVTLITKSEKLISSDVNIVNITKEVISDSICKKRKLSISNDLTKSFLIVSYNFTIPTNISNLTKSKKLNNVSIGIEIDNEINTLDGECNSGIKEVFSFLPIRSYGLKFLIQADFELTSSRESISIDSNWNIYIREIIPSAFIHMILKLREMNGFHLVKKSFLKILPTKADNIDDFFLPIISKIYQILNYEKFIYTYEKKFTQAQNSVFIKKSSRINEMLINIFPNIDEFSYLLSKYSNKFLIYNIFIDKTESILLEDLGISEFDINMLIDLISGIISDYSYFGKRYDWYFNLFLLIEYLTSCSVNINSILQKLQMLPLFLTEEGRYIEPININSSTKHLFFMEGDLPSISKLGVYFIKKDFFLQLKEFFKDEIYNYNKIMNFIQSLGVSFLLNDEYYEMIYESLTKINDKSIEDHVFFTFIFAKSNYISKSDKQILAINSNNEFLPLTPKYFHLINVGNRRSLSDNINQIIDNENTSLVCNFSFNIFDKRYLHHADEFFWNSFFSKFGITSFPFYFEKIQFSDLNDYKLYLKSCSKVDNNSLIDQHIESIHKIGNSNYVSITDFYCHGIESLATLMNDALTRHSGNEHFEELLIIISNQIIQYVCDFWEEIKIYWSITINEIIKKPSFVQLQFSSYPIFITRYLTNDSFISLQLCAAKLLTLNLKTHQHEVLSKFVNFLNLDLSESNLTILSDAFSFFIEINIDYLCLIIKALHNSNYEEISLRNRDNVDPNSYIILLGLIIKESKSNLSMSSIKILKEYLQLPFQDDNKNLTWKNIQELYWEDEEDILPKNHSLFYYFSAINKFDIPITDILGFFLMLNVSIKPEKKHLINYLIEIYKIKRIGLDSEILLTYAKIVTRLYKIDRTILKDLLQLPIIKKNYCKWLNLNLNKNYEIVFSDSILFHYFFYRKFFLIKKIIWSPVLFTFIQSNIGNQSIDSLVHDWNVVCLQPILNFENVNQFNICSDVAPTLSDSSFYYEIIVKLLGPLYEESIKNQIEIRKNWCEIVLKENIITFNSNFFINCLEKTVSVSSIFEIKTNKLYIKHQNKIDDNEIEEILLSIFAFICSFFPGNYPNSKSLTVAKLVFKNVVKEYEYSKSEINWDKFIISSIKKIETDAGLKVELKYFLFSDYVDVSTLTKSSNAQKSEELEIEFNTNCPKNITLEIGRIGEKLAFDSLKEKYNNEIGTNKFKIIWVNEIIESGLPYDIVLIFINEADGTEEKIFVEVKSSSKKEKNFFHVSFNEWKFAEKTRKNYWIFHILGVNRNAPNLGSKKLEHRIIINPFESWKNGNLKMILLE